MIKLGYVILYVPDVGTTIEFYEKAFALTRRLIHESGHYAEMETGSTTLAFASEELATGNGVSFKPTRPEHEAPSIEVALVVDDLKVAYECAITAGAVAVKEPTTKPWGQTVAYVRDNNGFFVELGTAVDDV